MEFKLRKRDREKKIYTGHMKEHFQGTERCRVNKTVTSGWRRGEQDRKVGRLEAVSLINTRGSSSSSNTQVYYKLYVCILDVLHKALKYRIIFLKTHFTAAGQGVYTA